MLLPAVVWTLAAASSLSASSAPSASLLAPPLGRGVAKNGVAIVAVSSLSPVTIAAVEITTPDDRWCVGFDGALSTMQAAARASVGPDAVVEARAQPGAMTLIVTTTASPAAATATTRAVKAVDAALSAFWAGSSRPPKPTASSSSSSPSCSELEPGVATQALLARLSGAHVVVAVVGPGALPELVRQAQAALRAPLPAGVGARRGPAPPPLAAFEPVAGRRAVAVASPRERAALEVLAQHAGLKVEHGSGGSRVVVSVEQAAVLRSVVTSPLSPAVIEGLAHARRLERACAIADRAALALTLAHDVSSGDDTWAQLEAFASVDGADVAAMAARMLEVQP
jgi:hypothetical protein